MNYSFIGIVISTVMLGLSISCNSIAASFTVGEIQKIRSLSGAHLTTPHDASNKASGNTLAITMGKRLFFDKRLTPDNAFSCASCHQPNKGWADGKVLSHIRQDPPTKHTPSLWNVAYNRWFFWDGRSDSLWNQALHTFESPNELNSNRRHIAKLMLFDNNYKQAYQHLFSPIPRCVSLKILNTTKRLSSCQREAVNQLFTGSAKMIAAFEETLISNTSPFDDFAKALKPNQPSSILSETAQQGLKLFIGKGQCIACHSGPNFSDSEFHSIFFNNQQADGRYQAIPKLLKDPFNQKSAYSDLAAGDFNKLDYVYRSIELRHKYKTPSLRNIALSAPYMHDGRMRDLKTVMRYYGSIAQQTIPKNSRHNELILNNLSLTDNEQQALIAFLHALTNNKVRKP